MAISYISSSAVEAATLTMPSHQAGDLLVMIAWRTTNNTAITIPAGWVKVVTDPVGAQYSVTAYKIAASAAETSGTWTNATMLACAVYRDGTNYLIVGNNRELRTTSTSITYAGAVARSTTTSWFVGLVGGSLNNTATETAPAGMTNRVSAAGASVGEIAIHDTNGAFGADWSSVNVTVSSEVAHAHVLEVIDTGIAKASGGGPLIGGRLIN